MNTEPVYCQTYTEVEASMRTAKDEIRSMLDALPDDASFEDVQYSIYVRERIERGLREADEGHLVDQDEVERRMLRWLEE
jgi:predicted transcriptional regulator